MSVEPLDKVGFFDYIFLENVYQRAFTKSLV